MRLEEIYPTLQSIHKGGSEGKAGPREEVQNIAFVMVTQGARTRLSSPLCNQRVTSVCANKNFCVDIGTSRDGGGHPGAGPYWVRLLSEGEVRSSQVFKT